MELSSKDLIIFIQITSKKIKLETNIFLHCEIENLRNLACDGILSGTLFADRINQDF